MSKQSGKEWRRPCNMAIANLFLRTKQVSRWTPRFTMSEIDEVLEFVVNKVSTNPCDVLTPPIASHTSLIRSDCPDCRHIHYSRGQIPPIGSL